MVDLRSAITLLLLCAATPALPAPAFDDTGPGLAPPAPSFQEPGMGFGPAGPSIPPPVDAKPEAPPLNAAERRKRHLDDLYTRLSAAKDGVEAHAIGSMIMEELLRSGSDTADLLMQRARAAVDAKNYPTATTLLDKIILLRPRWAEAWNERATVRYLVEDDVGAMADIGQVLLLEPRHFGALSGMGFILHRNGDDKDALTVLRRAAAINPQDADVKSFIDTLMPGVEGHEI